MGSGRRAHGVRYGPALLITSFSGGGEAAFALYPGLLDASPRSVWRKIDASGGDLGLEDGRRLVEVVAWPRRKPRHLIIIDPG